MSYTRISAILIVLAGIGVGSFIFFSEKNPGRFSFKLGLDLNGGAQLTYRADVSQIPSSEVDDAMDALRDVIERRVNLFGVSEPVVQVEKTAGIISEKKEERLIVELSGVTDIEAAIAMIGATPVLEFRLERPDGAEKDTLIAELKAFQESLAQGLPIDQSKLPDANKLFLSTDLTGRYLDKATLAFDDTTGAPKILLDFDEEGSKLFEKITDLNVGKILAIYLDGVPISQPFIQQKISGGQAEITGSFTPVEAKTLVGRLNSGALPIPIELLGSQTVGASLGAVAVRSGVFAGIVGLVAVMVFMILWYRVSGLVASIALLMYAAINLAIFKLIGVTLTAAGIAGFILSIGMAVDGNVLIFERMKEELRGGKKLHDAIRDGFDRAWSAIWDGNITAFVSAIVLFWFGTSLIQGFALTFGIGVLLSMLSSITISRTLLYAIAPKEAVGFSRTLFGSGIGKI